MFSLALAAVLGGQTKYSVPRTPWGDPDLQGLWPGTGPPGHWGERGRPQYQTSLVVDPSNGRLPPMTADGQKRTAAIPSVGRWDGATLVVDTTNFNGQTGIGANGRAIYHSDALHLVERFTRVSADRILYQFTVDDPKTWTRPWSAEIPMTQVEGPLYEFACHEGNYGLANTLSGARFADREAAQGTARTPEK